MKKTGCLGKVLMVLGILFVIIFVGVLFTDTDEPADEPEKAVVEETAKKKKADSEKKETEEEATAKEEATTEKEIPTEWVNALIQADTYANDLHMSKDALFDQLTSEYGGQFGKKAAQYAVDNVVTDWKENAYQKAVSYYEEMHMSKSDVYDQLVSEYGEQFTPKQAQYAIDKLK